MGLRYMDKLILDRIDLLLDHINLVFHDTDGLTIEEITQSNVLLRATCFSVSQIGEMMIQLEKKLAGVYPELPWNRARGMRNIIVHDYGGTDIKMVYSVIHNDLPGLKSAFLKIKDELQK